MLKRSFFTIKVDAYSFIFIKRMEKHHILMIYKKKCKIKPLSNGNDRACKDLQQQYRGIQIEQERVQ